MLVKIEFHTVQVIFCTAEELLSAKGGVSSMELVTYLERCSTLQLTLRYNCHIFSRKCLSLKLYTLITVRWPQHFIICVLCFASYLFLHYEAQQYLLLVPSIPLCWWSLLVSIAVKHNNILLNLITGCLYWLTTCFGQLHDHHQVYKS